MTDFTKGGVTSILAGMRRMLFASTVLVLLISFFLFLFPTRTETLFAWTIGVPLTAAFLGANYLASAFMTLLAARETVWARARVAVPGVILFTLLTTIVTFIHLDKFHLDSPGLFTRFVTWVWIAVYVLDPIFFTYAFVRQMRQPQVDPPRAAVLPGWYRLALLVVGAPMLLVGAVMLLAPAAVIGRWPWELTPLTAQAIGAWGVGIGFVVVHSAWENDWSRLRGMVVALALVGALQLVNLLRFSQAVEWGGATAILYVVFMVAAALVGGYGWWRAWRGPAAVPAGRAA